MTKILGTGDWACELIRAFGEDPKQTRRITLDMIAMEPVTVIIEKFVMGENSLAIETIKKVAWVEEPDSKVIETIDIEPL